MARYESYLHYAAAIRPEWEQLRDEGRDVRRFLPDVERIEKAGWTPEIEREARGVMVEEMPDASRTGVLGAAFKSLAVAQRNILKQLGLGHAELRRTTPLSFACRCSPERAAAMIAALPESERASLPPIVDVTCHMCGRTCSIARDAT